jgi:hypothetical protein
MPSAASNSAWTSSYVSGRRPGRPSNSVTCVTEFHSCRICAGTRPNRSWHSTSHPYRVSQMKSMNIRSEFWYCLADDTIWRAQVVWSGLSHSHGLVR